MRILPHDLGYRRGIAVMHRRASPGSPGKGPAPDAPGSLAELPDPHIGALGEWWSQGLNVPRRFLERAIPSIGRSLSGMFWAMGGPALVMLSMGLFAGGLGGEWEAMAPMGVFAAVMGSLAMLIPRFSLRRAATQPLGGAELDYLQSIARDELDRQYVRLVRQAMRITADPATESQIRDSLAVLGNAIDRLPLGDVEEASSEAFSSAAAEAMRVAESETDEVIAASMRRKAEALERAAEASGRARMVLRRAAALRDELSAQTDAMMLCLASFESGEGRDYSSLAEMAGSVRSVALEADAVADAREELLYDGARDRAARERVTAQAEAGEAPAATVNLKQS